MQSSLFPQKAVTDTSIEAYREIAPSLERRELQVLTALSLCANPPTAYELFEVMQRAGLVFDLNSVRPRLTSLCAKGYVVKGEKRRCAITHKTAYVYQVVER